MSLHHDHAEPVPRVPLAMIAALALGSVALAASASFGFVGKDAVPEMARASAGTQPVASRSLHFSDAADGGVLVSDAATGESVARIEPETGGFVRSTMRGLASERQRAGIGAETPFELTLYDDGGLVLSDPTTGATRELAGFGKDNRAAFAVLLESEDR